MGRLISPVGESVSDKKIIRQVGVGRPRKMGADSITKIKASATRLFAKNGYTNTSLDHIATDVGLTKGGIYYYFRSKEQLLLDILDDIESRSIGESSRAMTASAASGLERLLLFNKMQAKWALQNPSDTIIMMLTSLETVNDGSKVGDRIRVFYGNMESLLTSAIDQAKDSGELRSSLSTRNLALSMIAIHDGNILLWCRSGCDFDTGRILSSLFDRTLLELMKSTATKHVTPA